MPVAYVRRSTPTTLSSKVPPCPKCGSNNTVEIVDISKPKVHFAKATCKDCGRDFEFVRDVLSDKTPLNLKEFQ